MIQKNFKQQQKKNPDQFTPVSEQATPQTPNVRQCATVCFVNKFFTRFFTKLKTIENYELKMQKLTISLVLLFLIQETTANIPTKFEISGPGLNPSIVLPARYFFIKPLDKKGNL